MSINYPKKLNLASLPTPIQKLAKISADYGANIWVKRDDMTGSSTSGNKIRKLEYSLALAQQQGAKVLITCGGIQSNHCRAVAILGAQLGFKVHLILRGERPETVASHRGGNLLIGQIAGAEIDFYPEQVYIDNFESIVANTVNLYHKKNQTTFFIPTGGSDAHGVWGYLNASKEIAQQNICQWDNIVCASGSGGTQTGLSIGAAHYLNGAKVLGMAVCDDRTYFLKKIGQDINSWNALDANKSEASQQTQMNLSDLCIQVNEQYIGAGYAKTSKEVFDCIEYALRTEGLLLDPVYTGKAFMGMLSEIKKGNLTGNILFIHTGGIFGLMAQTQEYLSLNAQEHL